MSYIKSFSFTVETIDLVEVNFIILFTCCIDFNLHVMKINKIFDDRTIEMEVSDVMNVFIICLFACLFTYMTSEGKIPKVANFRINWKQYDCYL